MSYIDGIRPSFKFERVGIHRVENWERLESWLVQTPFSRAIRRVNLQPAKRTQSMNLFKVKSAW